MSEMGQNRLYTSLESLAEKEGFTLTRPGSESVLWIDQSPIRTAQDGLGVVQVKRSEQVQAIMRWASEHSVPVTPRGSGTGVSGGANVIGGGIILDLSPMQRILDISPVDQTAYVEPGVINADLGAKAAEHGLMYAPDPASFRLSTIGGNVATNAGGLRCAKYGVTRDSVLGLDVVLPNGELIHTGKQTFKGVVGLDLTSLIIGSEGTLGVVVGIRVRLRPQPALAKQAAFAFDSLGGAAKAVVALSALALQPAVIEFLDHGTMKSIDSVEGTRLADVGQALLLIETDGLGSEKEMEIIQEAVLHSGGKMTVSDAKAHALLEMRRQARGDTADHELRVGEDIAVPRSRLVECVEELEEIAEEHAVNFKIVAHAGDGNLHPSFWLEDQPDEESHRNAVDRLDRALDDSVRSALKLGGTISGEHGVGEYKLRWVPWEQPDVLVELQRGIKKVFDPQNIMNPNKVLPPAHPQDPSER